MRIRSVLTAGVALGLLLDCVSGTLMLTSLLMALKGGMFASKVGMGGIIAMMMAASRNQQSGGGGGGGNFKSNTFSSLGSSNTIENLLKSVQNAAKLQRRRSRRVRAIDPKLIPELPSLLNASVRTGAETEEASHRHHLSVEKLASELNNVSSPLTRRVMRQAAILDQLSCLPRLICGMTTVNPTKSSSLLNDYAFLTKFLFERDDDQEDDDDDDEKEGRLDAVALKKSSNTTYNDGQGKKKKKKKPTSDEYQDSDEVTVDDAEFDDDALAEDLKFDEMAEEELIKDDPTMLSYILADAGMRMKGYKKSPYLVDHSDLPGYAKGSHHASSNPHLNTYSAQAALNGAFSNGGYPVKRRPSSSGPKGSSRFEFQIGKHKEKDDTKSLLGHFLPGFVYEKIRARPSTSSSTDDFASDPFFDGFRRRRQLEMMEKMPQRPLNPQELEYVQRKLKEIQESTSPLKKYQVAEETGRLFRNQRQCRMLFARCPYTSTEVLTMIQNVRKLLNAQATVGDKIVNLKQSVSGAGQEDSIGGGTSLSSGSVLNVPLGGAGAKGVTQISHQLDNGDKVEIMLKIKQNDAKKKPSLFSSSTSDAMLLSQYNDKDLLEAHQNLLAMKRQFQALAKLHNATVALQFNNVSSVQIPASLLAAKDEAGYPILKQTGTKYTLNKYKVKNPFSDSQINPAPPTYDVYGQKVKAAASAAAPELQEDAGASAENSKPAEGSDENQSTSQEDTPASSEASLEEEEEESNKKKVKKTSAKATSERKKKKKPEEDEEEDEEDEEDQEDEEPEAEDDDQEDEEEESGEQSVPPEVPLEYLQSRARSKANKMRVVPGAEKKKKRPAAAAATTSGVPISYKKAPAPTPFVSRVTLSKSRPPAPLPTKPSPYKLRRRNKKNKGSRSQDEREDTE